MNTMPRVALPATLVLSMVVGCTEPEPPKSDAIERATSTEPTFTSAARPPLPDLADETRLEPPVLEVAEPPSQEASREDRLFEPELRSMGGLTIRRLVTAPKVEHREPVASSSVFGYDDEKVYAFLEVSNESENDETLVVHFFGPDGLVSGGIELRIPAAVPRWRTWAYTEHAKVPGSWRVEIRSVEGSLLGALRFEVDDGC